MIFSKKSIEDILSGKKTQTRRLVKEKESSASENGFIDVVYSDNIVGHGKVKWQVGLDYSVQLGRGKAGLWYCTECSNCVPMDKELIKKYGDMGNCNGSHDEVRFFQAFRIKITGIRKEHLLDISEEDAKAEGFETTGDFVKAFQHINWNKCGVDPKVWVLNFLVKK